MLGMLETAEVLRLILAALALGVVVPVMVQLFLTLRQARQSIALVTAQVEPSLRLFNELAQKSRPNPPGSQLASIVSSVVPAAIAAYRAFRQQQREEDHESSSSPSMIGEQDPSGSVHSVGHQGREMEKDK
jgi:hypothetical protein